MPKCSGPTAWTRGARRPLGLPRCSPRSGRRRVRVLGCMVGSSRRGRGCTYPQHGGPPVGAEEKRFFLSQRTLPDTSAQGVLPRENPISAPRPPMDDIQALAPASRTEDNRAASIALVPRNDADRKSWPAPGPGEVAGRSTTMPSEPIASDLIAGPHRAEPGSLALLRG